MECDKKSYETENEAAADLKGLRGRNKKHKFRTYRCPLCGMFHITTVTKKVLRPIKREKYPMKTYYESEEKSKHKSKKRKK